jgi:hypothetical protein
MIAFAVGNLVEVLAPGWVCPVTAVSGNNITVTVPGGSSVVYASSLLGLISPGAAASGVRVDSTSTGTAAMLPSDTYVQFTGTNTGFNLNSSAPSGRRCTVYNGTGSTFTTGDFNVVSAHVWEFIFDGTNWKQIVVA